MDMYFCSLLQVLAILQKHKYSKTWQATSEDISKCSAQEMCSPFYNGNFIPICIGHKHFYYSHILAFLLQLISALRLHSSWVNGLFYCIQQTFL